MARPRKKYINLVVTVSAPEGYPSKDIVRDVRGLIKYGTTHYPDLYPARLQSVALLSPNHVRPEAKGE